MSDVSDYADADLRGVVKAIVGRLIDAGVAVSAEPDGKNWRIKAWSQYQQNCQIVTFSPMRYPMHQVDSIVGKLMQVAKPIPEGDAPFGWTC